MGMFWKNTTTDSRCGKAEFEDLQEHAETGTKDDLYSTVMLKVSIKNILVK
jgi:hypothetical protein